MPPITIGGQSKCQRMNVRRSEIYPRLALAAAGRVGLEGTTPEGVAESPEARDVRDALWADYERMLADKNTYTLEATRAWLKEQGVKASLSAIARDRAPVLARVRQLEIIPAKVRQYLDATKDSSTGEVLEAARKRSADLLFEHLLGIASGGVEGVDLDQLRLMARAVASLSTADAQTQILDHRLAEMRDAFDAKVKAATKGRKNKTLTDGDVAEVRKAVFGSAA